jgi:hypothetical protein
MARQGGVVHGDDDCNTRPMSPISAASEHFRYFMGIASVSFNKPYHTGLSHKIFRQHNLLGKSIGHSRMVECRF